MGWLIWELRRWRPRNAVSLKLTLHHLQTIDLVPDLERIDAQNYLPVWSVIDETGGEPLT
jgi:hypothetical protein